MPPVSVTVPAGRLHGGGESAAGERDHGRGSYKAGAPPLVMAIVLIVPRLFVIEAVGGVLKMNWLTGFSPIGTAVNGEFTPRKLTVPPEPAGA